MSPQTKLLPGLLAFALISGAYPAILFAQTENPCDFKDALRELAAVSENATLSDDARSIRELELRINLLRLSIACGKQELVRFEKNIEEITGASKDTNVVAVAQIAKDKLTDALAHYVEFERDIESLDAPQVKERAQAVHEWRASELVTLMGWLANVKLWLGNQALFEKTADRLRQVQQTVLSFRMIDDEILGGIFERASTNFMRAKEENIRAKQAIERTLSPEETLGHIRGSLDFLSQTYRTFFELSGAIQRVLPR